MSLFWMPALLIVMKAEKFILVAWFIKVTVIIVAIEFQIFKAVKLSWTKINLIIIDINDLSSFKGIF